jgi:ESS family glutamate:Na+ symporter
MTQPDLLEIETIFSAVSIIAILLVAGLWLRHRSRWLTRMFLPGSVVAGVVALILGPDVAGNIARSLVGEDNPLGNGLFGQDIPTVWRALPSLLINIVFACLFLGKAIPSPGEIWRQAGPVVCYGQSIAWGQYVVGLVLAVLVLAPFFGMDPMIAALIEIGFEGGHGTAAGLAPVFDSLGFDGGVDLALGLASVGLLSAIVSGVVMINWARARGHLLDEDAVLAPAEVPEDMSSLLDGGPVEPSADDTGDTIDPMSLHLGLVALSILLGWVMLELLVAVERATWGASGLQLVEHVPLFPMAMIGGAIVQVTAARFGRADVIDRDLVNRIAGVSLDVIIVAALATLSLSVIADNLVPFLLLAFAGIAWNITGFLVLAPRMIPGPWFERGIPNFGQSMGMTVTGIMLYQMADPKNRSGGLERFGYKQLMFEPVVGGGLFTAMSLPLINEFGPWTMLAVTAVLLVFWLALGFRLTRTANKD